MNQRISERKAKARHQVAVGRSCLLALMVVSLLNQMLLALDVEYHFLISAALPYYLNWICIKMTLTGTLPVVLVVATALLYGAYVACWALSQQHRIWLTVALGLYGLDTLLLIIFAFTLLKNPASCLLEILTHFACIAVLAMAVHSAGALSRMRHTAHAHCGV